MDIYRRLTTARPEAFEADLAGSLMSQSVCLGELDRPDEALTAINGSVEIYRRLAVVLRCAMGPDAAKSRSSRGRPLIA